MTMKVAAVRVLGLVLVLVVAAHPLLPTTTATQWRGPPPQVLYFDAFASVVDGQDAFFLQGLQCRFHELPGQGRRTLPLRDI